MSALSIPLHDDFTAIFHTSVDVGDLTTREIPQLCPDEQDHLARWLRRFEGDGFEATLVVGPIVPRIPRTMSISGCVAAVWKVTATRRLDGIRIQCEWSNPPATMLGSPSSGEGLDCIEWEADGTALALGTEDGDFLSGRAEYGDGIPLSLAEELDYGTVECVERGLVVPFSRLEPGESLQIHFLVAWKHPADEGDVSPWFAVGQDHSHVVRALTP